MSQRIAENQGGVPAPDEAARPKRADARRNQELLIDAARQVFQDQGVSASMESIAKTAGVGVGTLYRHFPCRIDVVEAVYSTDVEELAEAARSAVADLEPWPAVVAFFDAFVRYARTKQTLLGELQKAFEKDPDLQSRSREKINGAFDLVIDRAREAGVIRADVRGSDITQLVAPVCTNPGVSPDQRELLISMILDGLRYQAEGAERA